MGLFDGVGDEEEGNEVKVCNVALCGGPRVLESVQVGG